MNQIQAYPPSGVVVPHENYAPEVDKTGAGTYVTESHNSAPGNAVLEQDAQTKGRWFQYVKTKQFWITLLLGQGTYIQPTLTIHTEKYTKIID
jgi:solute carrier family 35 protein F1/2